MGSIVGPAWSWRWQAPELALVFGERALRTADQRGDQLAGLWAQTLVVSASCRLGQQLAVTDKAIDALRLSERLADDAAGAILRVELAGCARSAGVPLVGAGLLRPVLSATDIRPAVRAAALIQLAGCLAYSERHRELDGALAEADQLYADDAQFDQDTRLGLRAVLRSFVAREHRRRGDLRSALHAAEEGANLLAGLSNLSADGGAAARISLQQVLGLLDLGWIDQAATVAAGALSGPVRAHSAAAVGWLALAISTRVQLPAGLIEPAVALLREIASMAERHHRDALHAESLSALSEAHELAGELAETLDYLRSAQVVRARRSRALRAARSALLGAFGEARNAEDLLRLLNPTLSTGRRRTVERGQPLFGQRADTPPSDASGITLVLIDVAKNRSGMAPTARGPVASGSLGPGAAGIGTWTAESLGAGSRVGDPVGEGVLRKVVEHLRDLTPAEAALARVGGAELAVLLPGTSRNQVERWAEELRAAMANVDWSQVTPGLTVNVRTLDTEDQPHADKPSPEPHPARAANLPAAGIALDAQPTRSRRSGELTSPRLPIPPQPTEPERSSALAVDQPVPPARAPEQSSGGRRARGTQPVEQPTSEPVRTPLPQASLSGLFPPPPEPTPDPEEAARRRHAASQEPTQRWTPTWLPDDEESNSGRWLLDPSEAKPAEPVTETPSGVAGGGRRRSEDAQPATPARPSHRSPEVANMSTSDTGRRRAEETPVAEAGSRHSAPVSDSSRSVLDSLGISGGSGGGRRRAPEAPDTLAPQEPPHQPRQETSLPAASNPQPTGSDSEPTGRRARRDYSQPLAGLIPAVEPSSGGRRRAEDTIPKIRLPKLPIPPQQSQPPSSQPLSSQSPSSESLSSESLSSQLPSSQLPSSQARSSRAEQPQPPTPGPVGFPGAAFPGSGFSGLNPTAMPSAADDDLTPPSGFAMPAGLMSPPPATGLTPPPTLTQPAAPSYEPTPYVAIPPITSSVPPSSTPSTPSARGVALGSLPPIGMPVGDQAPSGSVPGSAPSSGSVPSGAAPGGRLPASPMSGGSLAGSSLSGGDVPGSSLSGGDVAGSSFSGGGVPSGTPLSGRVADGPTPSGSVARADSAEAAPSGVVFPSEPTSSGTAAPVDLSGVDFSGLGPAEAGTTESEATLAGARPAESDVVPPRGASPAAQFIAGFNSGISAASPEIGEAADTPGAAKHDVPVEQDSAEGGSSFSALSEFSAMLAQFDDKQAPAALELPEPSTTPLPPEEPSEAAALPEPELTPPSRAEQAAQPFAPETMFGGVTHIEEKEPLRPTPPPPGIAAKLAGPETESDVASIEGRSARGRRRSPKLGDLLTEALRAYQDVRDADEANDALGAATEPSELGATELGSWLGTGTEPVGSIDPPSWRPGSSTRSFGVTRHSSGDDGDARGPDWNPPTS
ncbi:MAG TPA: diguanylate cyclase [Pseudonocardiaceae bacterium]|nr:diguanylate cyclase [Pseudonocardiaceae bacterium]